MNTRNLPLDVYKPASKYRILLDQVTEAVALHHLYDSN